MSAAQDGGAALLALAERCESATGPDLELDAEIWLACVPGTTRRKTGYLHAASGKWCEIDETRENHRLIIVPAYTASLDAAMTLVPDIIAPRTPAGRWPTTVDLRRHDDGTGSVQVRANDSTMDGATDELYAEAPAATPALALCAAALRARSAAP